MQHLLDFSHIPPLKTDLRQAELGYGSTQPFEHIKLRGTEPEEYEYKKDMKRSLGDRRIQIASEWQNVKGHDTTLPYLISRR